MKEKSNRLFTFIFCTCDDYSFLWDNFFLLLSKYWEGFNYPIVSTGSKSFITSGFEVEGTLCNESSFSSRLLKALENVKTDIVLLMLDDFYMNKPVNKTIIDNAVQEMILNKKIKCVNLFEGQSQNNYGKEDYNPYFVVKDNKKPFSATTQASFWDKKYLIKLLHKGESAWDFEWIGSIRNRFYNPLILYRKDYVQKKIISYPYCGVFYQGSFGNSPEVIETLNNLEFKVPRDIHIVGEHANYNSSTSSFLKRFLKFIYRYLSIFFPSLPYFLH